MTERSSAATAPPGSEAATSRDSEPLLSPREACQPKEAPTSQRGLAVGLVVGAVVLLLVGGALLAEVLLSSSSAGGGGGGGGGEGGGHDKRKSSSSLRHSTAAALAHANHTVKKTPQGPVGCTWYNENCLHSKCCAIDGQTCFKRNEREAFCWPTCKKHEGEPCEKIGGPVPDRLVKAVPSGHNTSGYSLFCFSVVTPGVNHEEELLGLARKHHLGIFQCDESTTYEGVPVPKGDWGSFKNVDIFHHVWNQVKQEGRYKRHDWTIKVDLDAVFFPDRLRANLQKLRPPPNQPLYIENVDFAFHFMGAIEILSQDAVKMLLKESQVCLHGFGDQGPEDGFTKHCLRVSGAGYMQDYEMLADKYSLDSSWHPDDVDWCTHKHAAALHPFKEAFAWFACWKVAVGQQQPSDFVSCAHRWKGDACSKSGWRSHPNYDLTLGIVHYH